MGRVAIYLIIPNTRHIATYIVPGSNRPSHVENCNSYRANRKGNAPE